MVLLVRSGTPCEASTSPDAAPATITMLSQMPGPSQGLGNARPHKYTGQNPLSIVEVASFPPARFAQIAPHPAHRARDRAEPARARRLQPLGAATAADPEGHGGASGGA